MKPSKVGGKSKVEYWKHARWLKRVFAKAERRAVKRNVAVGQLEAYRTRNAE